MENYLNKIACIIEEVADIPSEDIELESSIMDDLSLTSMEIITVIAEVEKAFKVKISETELLKIDLISELIACIESKI